MLAPMRLTCSGSSLAQAGIRLALTLCTLAEIHLAGSMQIGSPSPVPMFEHLPG